MEVNQYYLTVSLLVVALSIALYFFFLTNEKVKRLNTRFADVLSVENEVTRLNNDISNLSQACAELNQKYKEGLIVYKSLEDEIGIYKDTLEAYEYGLYQPQFNFDTSQEYKEKLLEKYKQERDAIKNDAAIHCTTQWTVNGKTSEGKRMTNKYKKLMLFAFNGECDSLISKVKWHNVTQTRQKIRKAFDNINKLGSTHNTTINESYLTLKFEELALAYEYELKKYEEKEEQRRIREELREEERARMEYVQVQRKADEEEKRYQKALNQAINDLGKVDQSKVDELNMKIALLEQNLRAAQEKKERAISMAQLTKAGHIYVISNIGSFGEGVYKIGMTRRLEPMDRIRELGDASVPFRFDVHAIIFSEDAPRLEYEIHKAFASRRVNMTNHRREFFKVSLEEIKDHVLTNLKSDVEFLPVPEAREFRETLSLLENFNNDKMETNSDHIFFPETLFEEDVVD